MSPLVNALREGLRRGCRELVQMLTNGQDLASNLVWIVGLLAPLLLLRDNALGDTGLSVAAFILPSLLSMCIAFNGMLSLAQQLVLERQDGTLLRMKALPHGMLACLVGKIVLIASTVLVASALVVVTGIATLPDVAASAAGPDLWLTLAWILPLGLLAMLPVGAVAGSLLRSPRNMGLIMLPLFALASISGLFFPASQLPTWAQSVAEFFPLYWIGLASRSALLPNSAVAAELGESWRHLETVGVLGAWAVAGLVIAPVVLRRMANRESGSAMTQRRDLALRRPA